MNQREEWWEGKPKRQGHPWYRLRNIVLLTVLVVLAWAGVFGYSVMYAKPVRATDYGAKAVELIRTRQGMPLDEETSNGWLILRGLVDKVSPLHDRVIRDQEWGGRAAFADTTVFYDPSNALPEGATRAQVEELGMAYIEALRAAGVFDDLNRLRETPYAARERLPGNLLDWMLPELGTSRNLARANTARMFLAHRAGDEATRLEAMDQSLATAQVIARQNTLIDHLVGVAISALTLGEVRREMVERPPTEAECAALLGIIDKRLPLPPMAVAFEGERLMVMDTMQSIFSDTGNGNGRLLLTEMKRLGGGGVGAGGIDRITDYKIANLAGLVLPDRKANTAKINEAYEGMIRISKLPRSERAGDPFNIDSYHDKLSRKYLFLHLMLPAIGKALQSRDQVEIELAGTRLMLAVEMHRARHGTYPAALSELSPGILPTIPVDPLNGKSFGYRVLAAGEDPDGRGYLLYSIGGDGVDDAGKSAEYVLDALWKPKAKGAGTDYVFNTPRPKPAPEAPPALGGETQEEPVQGEVVSPSDK